jgi:hypothetical protein
MAASRVEASRRIHADGLKALFHAGFSKGVRRRVFAEHIVESGCGSEVDQQRLRAAELVAQIVPYVPFIDRI